jgi:capsule biosynthesis phosphatase
MNILIPLGGLGKRFSDEGYIKPKILININGKPMILWLLDKIIRYIDHDDNIYLIYNNDLDNWNFKNTIISYFDEFKNNINFIKTNKQTDGSAHTILLCLDTLTNEQLNKKVIIMDGDTFYDFNIIDFYKNIDFNLTLSFIDDQNKPIYSYLSIDNDTHNISISDIKDKNKINNYINNELLSVSDIKEKNKISDYANCGCYCFLNGFDLKNNILFIMNNNIKFNNEFYISCVIKQYLSQNIPIKTFIINNDDFNCVGTPLQLRLFYCKINNDPDFNNKQLRFCFDLDNTLVTSPIIKDDYSTVQPIEKNIDYLNYLKNKGHYIIINTARRMKTHNSNIGKIIKDIGMITLQTLDKFNIQYDELYFEKPYADFYIDDKAINAHCNIEKETGIYMNSVKERDFHNSKLSSIKSYVKYSNSNYNLNGEYFWYKNIPNNIKNLFPIMINFTSKNNNDDINSIEMEYINGITISRLYVNELLNEDLLL